MTTLARELWWDDLAAIPADAHTAPFATAAAAIVAGEPRRAGALLDRAGPLGDELLEGALRYLIAYLDQNWWPGPTGSVITSAPVLPEASPPEPKTGDPQRDVLLATLGQVLPQSLALRSVASGARSAG